MSSGTTSGGNPARHARRPWLAAGCTAAARLLALYALLLAGAGLLLALIAPMLLTGVLIARGLTRQSAVAVTSAQAGPNGGTGPFIQPHTVGPGIARFILSGVVLLAGLLLTVVLLPYLLRAIRGLAWLTRRVVADWSGVPAKCSA